MTFAQLRTEFFARGFDFLNDGGAGLTRAKAWINQAYLECCDESEWPFLETDTSNPGTVPITDLKTVLWVRDTTNNQMMQFMDRRAILENVDPDLSTTGTPYLWYLDDTTVKVYPVNSSVTVRVKYTKIPTELSADADVPLVPSRFQDIIIDGAVRRALIDNNDAAEAQAVEQERQGKLNTMLGSLMNRNAFEPDSMQSFQWSEL